MASKGEYEAAQLQLITGTFKPAAMLFAQLHVGFGIELIELTTTFAACILSRSEWIDPTLPPWTIESPSTLHRNFLTSPF